MAAKHTAYVTVAFRVHHVVYFIAEENLCRSSSLLDFRGRIGEKASLAPGGWRRF